MQFIGSPEMAVAAFMVTMAAQAASFIVTLAAREYGIRQRATAFIQLCMGFELMIIGMILLEILMKFKPSG